MWKYSGEFDIIEKKGRYKMVKKKYLVWLVAGCMMLSLPARVLASGETAASETETQEEAAGEEQDESGMSENAGETGADVLGDDIYSFQLEFDGDLMKIPMSYEELTSMGWEINNPDELETMVETNTYVMGVIFNKGDYRIEVDMLNLGINEAPVSECLAAGISIDACDFDNDLIENQVGPDTLMLPGGVAVGTADIDAIKAAYGEPTEVYENETYSELTYEKDFYEEVTLTVYKETGTLLEVEMTNFVEPENFDRGTVSTETPPIVADYQAPTAPGEDILDPVVEFMGDFYQLPAPVSAFVANGWEIQDVEEGAFAEGGGLEFIDMMKDNQTVHFSVYNLTENAVTLENCFVTELKFGTYDPEVLDLKIAGNVTLGASKDELKAMAEEKGYICEEDGDYLEICRDEDSRLDDYLSIWFNKDEDPDKAASITVHHEAPENS